MARKHYTFAQKTCIGKAGFMLQQTSALWPSCRIGIAMSGGVDSFVLAKVMKIRQGITPFKFELLVLHCNPGFNSSDHSALLQWAMDEGLAAHLETGTFGPDAHSDKNRKNSPCFLCARERRKRLFNLCKKYRLTHLALGHNLDDLLSTFLLNFMRNGRVEGLAGAESFFSGRLQLIRPLLFVEKKYIRQAARQWNLPVWINSCPSAGKTARSQMEELATCAGKAIPDAEKSMQQALARWQLEKDINRKACEAERH